jgi:t-SNARE complex subunit (syntaxin)
MLLKITQEQGQKMDSISDHIESSLSMTDVANRALLESEKSANSDRKKKLALGLIAGAVVCVMGAVTTVSVLKSQNKL